MAELAEVFVKEECDTEDAKQECIAEEDPSVIKPPSAKRKSIYLIIVPQCFYDKRIYL